MNINNPSQYERVKYFVKTKQYITHSALQTKFNIRYVESKELIHMLQSDKVIGEEFNVEARGYEVFQKVYKAGIKND